MPNAGAGIRLLPNAITVLALCAGLSALKFALDGNFTGALAAIGLAALLDALDGRLARLLDATSRIGAELDSLADSVSFGVAPAVVLFVWSLHGIRVGWPVALVFTVCVVLRLARFNTLLDDTEALPFTKEFFIGIPSPAGALPRMYQHRAARRQVEIHPRPEADQAIGGAGLHLVAGPD